MSDDYLWDKSGADGGTEKLEKLLGEAKYQRAAPPTPAKAEGEAVSTDKVTPLPPSKRPTGDALPTTQLPGPPVLVPSAAAEPIVEVSTADFLVEPPKVLIAKPSAAAEPVVELSTSDLLDSLLDPAKVLAPRPPAAAEPIMEVSTGDFVVDPPPVLTPKPPAAAEPIVEVSTADFVVEQPKVLVAPQVLVAPPRLTRTPSLPAMPVVEVSTADILTQSPSVVVSPSAAAVPAAVTEPPPSEASTGKGDRLFPEPPPVLTAKLEGDRAPTVQHDREPTQLPSHADFHVPPELGPEESTHLDPRAVPPLPGEATQLPTHADFHLPKPPPPAPPPEVEASQMLTRLPGGVPVAPLRMDEPTQLPTRADFHLPVNDRAPVPGAPEPTARTVDLRPHPAPHAQLKHYGDRIRRGDAEPPQPPPLGAEVPTQVRLDELDQPTRVGIELPALEDRTSILDPARLQPWVPQPTRRTFALFRGRTPFVIAAALSLVAGVWAWSAISRVETAAKRDWSLAPVVVAARDIPEGTVLTMDMLSQRAIPVQFISPSVVKPESAPFVLSQRVSSPLQAGDPFLWSEFETVRAAEHLSNRIVRKARAITIPTGKEAGVGGWVRPSDHVDIISTFRDPRSNAKLAVTLLQDVVVLSTGTMSSTTNVALASPLRRAYGNVSLMVMPEEAEILVLAHELGPLNLTLRNGDDIELKDRSEAALQTLLSGRRTLALKQRRESIIEVIRSATPVREGP